MANLTRRAFGHIVSALGLAAIGARAAGRPAARMWASSVDRQQRMSEQPPVEFSPRKQRAAAHSPPFTAYPSTLSAHPDHADSGHRRNQPHAGISRALNRHNGRGLSGA
ncbi:MAG: hypothetical protein IPJ07_09490 [Acidobacteria bacterium]|nr:hypothetical protein [Acidobacteriota bacterium]